MLRSTNHRTVFRSISVPAWVRLVALFGLYLLGSAIAPPLELRGTP
ncbi:hypothetical protein [Burkholderia cenocepacia]|nr:hypothetical protein [Burkholderia cenocepacia]